MASDTPPSLLERLKRYWGYPFVIGALPLSFAFARGSMALGQLVVIVLLIPAFLAILVGGLPAFVRAKGALRDWLHALTLAAGTAALGVLAASFTIPATSALATSTASIQAAAQPTSQASAPPTTPRAPTPTPTMTNTDCGGANQCRVIQRLDTIGTIARRKVAELPEPQRTCANAHIRDYEKEIASANGLDDETVTSIQIGDNLLIPFAPCDGDGVAYSAYTRFNVGGPNASPAIVKLVDVTQEYLRAADQRSAIVDARAHIAPLAANDASLAALMRVITDFNSRLRADTQVSVFPYSVPSGAGAVVASLVAQQRLAAACGRTAAILTIQTDANGFIEHVDAHLNQTVVSQICN